MSRPIFVYVIGVESGPVKVGISNAPRARLSSIQTGCPYPLSLLHEQAFSSRDEAAREERIFHDVHRDVRLVGEWFDMPADLAIESIETGVQIEEYYRSHQWRA